MIDNLASELETFGMVLMPNSLNPDFSDYIIKFNERIIGYGWKNKNENEKVGFMGVMGPAWENCIWRDNRMPDNLNFNEVINLFQFAVSEDFIWFSLPAKNILGNSSNPHRSTTKFISNLKRFIESGFEP